VGEAESEYASAVVGTEDSDAVGDVVSQANYDEVGHVFGGLVGSVVGESNGQ